MFSEEGGVGIASSSVRRTRSRRGDLPSGGAVGGAAGRTRPFRGPRLGAADLTVLAVFAGLALRAFRGPLAFDAFAAFVPGRGGGLFRVFFGVERRADDCLRFGFCTRFAFLPRAVGLRLAIARPFPCAAG